MAQIPAERILESLDRHLDEMARPGEADRRSGRYGRDLSTELGAIELRVPRIRHFNQVVVVRAYARRARHYAVGSWF